MFAGFNLELQDVDFLRNDVDYFKIGKRHLSYQEKYCRESLEKYVTNGTIDGTEIQEDWFPSIKTHVFISHSHTDYRLATELAGWLNYTFGLKCFVDSNVWRYANDLLEMINREYSDKRMVNGRTVYNHRKCNIASQHVNIMLLMALQKMIDKTEVIFLLNTPNSIPEYSEIYKTSTHSPWIYAEIVSSGLIRQRSKEAHRNVPIPIFETRALDMKYKVDLRNFEDIGNSELLYWESESCGRSPGLEMLDVLYEITGLNE